MKKLSPFILSIFLLVTASCKKDKQLPYNPVPYVTVNFQINIDNPAYLDLNNQGGYVYLNGGVKGVVVVHGYDDMFYACDRACPFHPNDSCAQVNMQKGNLYLVCGHYEGNDWKDCCGSKYHLDGGLISGPSQYQLRAYRVQQNGSMLSIIN